MTRSIVRPAPVDILVRLALGAAVSVVMVLGPLVAPVPSALAAGGPKVVIVVGPVGSATASYLADADAAATEALKYTSNVVTLSSPNATWDVVAPALQGASIVIYMGHGNGFPSPYGATLQPGTEDGLGLNPTAGVDDTTTQYWGEQDLATQVKLAPNAVVILGHLCYASGSSEPGNPDPTQSEAGQRVDNFAAGFLAAGARAVIAEAYDGSAANYVDALFTAHDTIGNIWANSSSKQGDAFSFASTRTPGMTVEMDPDHVSDEYWRSMVGDPTLSSDAVVSGSPAASPAPTPSPSNPGPSPTASPAPTPSPTPSDSQLPAGASAGSGSTIGTVRWTTTTVNVRGHPTTANKPLFVLSPGTPVRVVRLATDHTRRTWYLVRVHSRLGWLAAWLTSATRPGAAATDPGWQDAQASSYGIGDGLLGSPLACGGTLTESVLAVANLSLPCGTDLLIRSGGHVVQAQVLDRGPYVTGLSFDLAPAVCRALDNCDGVIAIQWQVTR